jgi:hypothetical protein
VQPAFAPPLRAHAANIVMSAHGASQPALGVGLADLPEIDARRFCGAIVHEEGVLVRVYSARLKAKRPRLYDAVRIEMPGDTAWGLVSIVLGVVTVAVVGGGLPLDAGLWSRLVRLVPQKAEPIERDALVPLVFGEDVPDALWAVRTLEEYEYRVGDGRQALVTLPAGPTFDGYALALANDGWRRAKVLEQQPTGVTQFEMDGAPGTNVEYIAAVPAAA